MKAWMKGATFGFVSGFIYWAYVMITKLHLYESEKYDIVFYSFFYGVVLVGVFLGVLFHIWSNVDRLIIIAGSVWGLFCILILSVGQCSSSQCTFPEFTIFIKILSFPGWISLSFFQLIGVHYVPSLPGSIGIITLILLLLVTGPLSLILFKNMSLLRFL